MLQRALWKLAVVALAAVALYTLAGYLLAPRLVRNWVETTDGPQQLVVGEVATDPFAFHVSLADTALVGPGNQRLVSIPRADAVVQPAGIATWTVKLDDLTLYAPNVKLASTEAVAQGPSHLNAGLLQLAAVARALPLPEAIGDLKIVGGRVRFGDPAPARASFELTDLDLRLTGLSPTSAAPSPFELAANVNRGTRLEGSGHLAYGEEQVRIVGDFTADAVGTGSPGEGSAEIKVDRLRASGVDIDTRRPAPSVQTLRLEKPELRLLRPTGGSTGGQADWLRWLASPNGSDPLIHRVEIVDGRALFIDRQAAPTVRLELRKIDGTIQRDTAKAAPVVAIEAQLAPSGSVALAAGQEVGGEAGRFDFGLRNVELPLLSPYFEAAAGRGIRAGHLDLALRYEHASLGARITVDGLQLADRTASPGWPLELAVALLEDASGRIEIDLPPKRTGPLTPGAIPGALLASLRKRIGELDAAPFETLARIADRPEANLGALPFEPGSAEITPVTASRLETLGKALMERPGLGIKVHPAQDPAADRQALAAQQVRLHVALATSAPPGTAQQQPLELNDPKVRGILDEFGSTRLPSAIRKAISDRHPDADGAYYRAVLEALVENESGKVSDTALARLARYRAQSVVGALLALGVPAERLAQAENIDAVENRRAGVLLRLEAKPARALEPIAATPAG